MTMVEHVNPVNRVTAESLANTELEALPVL